jgi:hypothetical protein
MRRGPEMTWQECDHDDKGRRAKMSADRAAAQAYLADGEIQATTPMLCRVSS